MAVVGPEDTELLSRYLPQVTLSEFFILVFDTSFTGKLVSSGTKGQTTSTNKGPQNDLEFKIMFYLDVSIHLRCLNFKVQDPILS